MDHIRADVDSNKPSRICHRLCTDRQCWARSLMATTNSVHRDITEIDNVWMWRQIICNPIKVFLQEPIRISFNNSEHNIRLRQWIITPQRLQGLHVNYSKKERKNEPKRVEVYNNAAIFRVFINNFNIRYQPKLMASLGKFYFKKIKLTLIRKLLVFWRYFEFLRTTPSDFWSFTTSMLGLLWTASFNIFQSFSCKTWDRSDDSDKLLHVWFHIYPWLNIQDKTTNRYSSVEHYFWQDQITM